MKNAFKLCFLLVLVLLANCEKDEYLVPIVQTGEVTDITNSGVIFHGKITGLGNREILDHGFVWDLEPDPSVEKSYIKSLGTASACETFEAEVTSAFISGRTYFVRTFIRDEESVVYGRIIQFVSLGSEAPFISSFAPETASWGDTITITGDNFSNKAAENIIKFNEDIASMVAVSDKEIEVIVPNPLVENAAISVSVIGNKGVANKEFILANPEITSFTPNTGTYKTTVEIIGQNYHPTLTSVKFDTITAKIINCQYKKINVEVPPNVHYGDVKIYVTTPVATDSSEQNFKSLTHYISDFYPKTATFGDEITIEGGGFSYLPTDNIVKFGNIEALVKSNTLNQLTVVVPNSLTAKNSNLSVYISGQLAESKDNFILKDPIINNYTTTGTFGDLITINGNNFNPISASNIVKFGSFNAEVVSASLNQLQVKVPNNYYSENGKTKIMITVGELTTISTGDFELLMHSISSFTPDYGSRGDEITITGQNFNPDKQYNNLFIGDAKATVTSSSANSITCKIDNVVIHGDQPIKLQIAGREIVAGNTFKIYEPWRRVADFPGVPRHNAIGFMINEYGYVLGGNDWDVQYQDFWRYDPVQNSWKRMNDFPFKISLAIPVYSANGVYLFANKQIYRYDKFTDEWTLITTYPGKSNYNQVAFAIDNKLYFGAIINEYNDYYYESELWEYDEQTSNWTSKGSMNLRWVHSNICFSFNYKGYWLYPGLYRNEYTTLKEYDPISNTWIDKFDFNPIIQYIENSRYGSVGVLMNQMLYIAAGANGSQIFADVYKYDLNANSCIRLIDMPQHGRRHGTGFAINNKLYIGLGSPQSWSSFYTDLWEFDQTKLKP